MSSTKRPEHPATDDGMAGSSTVTRKQIQEMIRKRKPLTHMDLRGANLSGLHFDEMDLSWTKLAEADLSCCSFKNADLTGASLWNANCQNASFDGAQLEEADLDYAHLDGCTFLNSRIRKAILPLDRIPLESFMESVRRGTPVRMAEPAED